MADVLRCVGGSRRGGVSSVLVLDPVRPYFAFSCHCSSLSLHRYGHPTFVVPFDVFTTEDLVGWLIHSLTLCAGTNQQVHYPYAPWSLYNLIPLSRLIPTSTRRPTSCCSILHIRYLPPPTRRHTRMRYRFRRERWSQCCWKRWVVVLVEERLMESTTRKWVVGVIRRQ